jgi:hypothetical protein
MRLGIAAEMKLVDYGVLPGDDATAGLALPAEIRVDHDAFRNERSAVALVECRIVGRFELIAEHRRVPRQIAENLTMPAGAQPQSPKS